MFVVSARLPRVVNAWYIDLQL